MNRTLYDLSDELRAVRDALAEADIAPEEQIEAIDAYLEGASDLRTKLDAYCCMIREFQVANKARFEEAQRLIRLARSDEAAAKTLLDRLLWFLRQHNLQKLETQRFSISRCANGGVLPVKVPDDPEELPPDFRRVVTTANTEAIRRALEAGEAVEGCSLGERGEHVRIR